MKNFLKIKMPNLYTSPKKNEIKGKFYQKIRLVLRRNN